MVCARVRSAIWYNYCTDCSIYCTVLPERSTTSDDLSWHAARYEVPSDETNLSMKAKSADSVFPYELLFYRWNRRNMVQTS